jgi:hypothetical protein
MRSGEWETKRPSHRDYISVLSNLSRNAKYLWLSASVNLHQNCHILHAVSPTLSASLPLQAIGRIVRFGQKHHCHIVEYFVPGTHNMRQLKTSAANALVTIAALLCGEAGGGQAGSETKETTLPLEGSYVLVDGLLYNAQEFGLPDIIMQKIAAGEYEKRPLARQHSSSATHL